MVEKMLTVEDVSSALNIEMAVVRRMLRNGELVGNKIGKEWRVGESRLEEYLERTLNVKVKE